MRKFSITAAMAALSSSLLVFVAMGTANAANGVENPATLCVKDSPASSTYFQVLFFDQFRSPQEYTDPVFPGGTEGECGNANVFSEPEKYFVASHYQTRHRYWLKPYTTAGPWSAWIRTNCTAGSWWWLPGGDTSTYQQSTLTEIQVLPC